MKQHHPEEPARNPIAIVGVAGLFPMAHTYRDFWQNVVDAADCTEEVPPSRWRAEDYYDPDPSAPDKTYCTRGGFVPDVPFSPLEWGLPPNQLEVTTAVQLLSLGVARDLLSDAGAVGSDWYDPSRTGVVLGSAGPTTLSHPLAARLSTPVLRAVVRSCGLSEQDAEEIAARYVEAFPQWEENSFPGLLANVIAGRIANRLDLGGMNLTVDAACASSLSAVHIAIGELVSGRADMMITGGCDTENSIFGYMCFSKTQALSRSGRIRPFDDDADGTLVGEGIGMLALKRLADAQRDGDRVYAVIRGVGSSSDGRFKSIYAPRAEGQALALRRAYADAGVSPASIGLFEAHATGTRVGDRTELTALDELLREATDEKRFAAIGSVKSQIGHTKGAAGAASLIKLALALYHKTLPPTINVDRPNTTIEFADSGFYLNTTTRPWIADPKRPVRRAAASAMGFGGTNFHVVVEEAGADRAAIRTHHRTAKAHLWHAPDPESLLELLRSGAEPSRDIVPQEHARVGFASLGEAESLRATAIESLAADPDAESWSHPSGVFYRRRALPDVRIGALFAGQGSQYVDMGLSAVLNNPLVASAFDDANATFAGAERTLAEVVFPPASFEGATRADSDLVLRRTENAQPGIGALAAGQFRFLTALGLDCAGFLGHSFGELTALWAAGALDDAAFFALARARGLAMAPPADPDFDAGAMLALEADRNTVTELLSAHPGVSVCNHNAPDQVVVGGSTLAVAEVAAACKRHGIGATPLPVAAAFHTERVEHAVDAFAEALAGVEIGAPAKPVFANTAGATYGADADANRRNLAEQLRRPVEFVDGVRALRASGCTVFVEFGPKRVLSQLAERILGANEILAIATDLGASIDSDLALRRAAVQLAVVGAPVHDINRFDAEPLQVPRPEGMTVTLTGHDYVPDSREAAYAAALDGAYQISTAEAALVTPVTPVTPPAGPIEPGPSAPALPEASAPSAPVGPPTADSRPEPPVADGFGELAAKHLDLHSRYVEGQLRIADGLVEALEHATTPGAQAAVEAVTGHSVAIGETHVRVNEILAALAERELGGTTAEHPASGWSAATRPEPATTPEPATQSGPVRLPAVETPAVPQPRDTPQAAPAEAVAAAPVVGSGDVDSGDVESVLVEVVAEKTGYPVELVDSSMDLEADLGVDSIKRVQILGALGERFPELPAVSPEQVGELRTVADVVGFLTAAPAEAVAAAPVVGSGDVDSGDVESVLVEVVAEKTGYPVELVDSSMDLEADLGVDSIKRVQILGALGERFPELPAVSPEQVGELRTVADVVRFLTAAPADTEQPPASTVEPVAEPPDITRLHLELTRLPAVDEVRGAYAADPVAVVTCGHLAETLERRGWQVVLLERDLSWDAATAERMLAEQVGKLGRIDLCLVTLTAQDWAAATETLAGTLLLAKHVLPKLTETAGGGRAAFVTVTRLDGGLGHHGTAAEADAMLGGVAGLVKTLRHEEPSVFSRSVDLAPELPVGTVADLLLAEISDADVTTAEVGIDAEGRRWTPRFAERDDEVEPAAELADDEVLVVTGGARGVTAACVRALADRCGGEYLLLGRTQHGDLPAWAEGVAEGGLKPALIEAMRAEGGELTPREIERRYRELLARREIQETLDALRASGARATYVAVDVTDAAAVRAALAEHAPRVTGVVHGAGALADARLADKTPEAVRTVLGAKLTGLRAVLDALSGAPLRHLLLFASVAGVYGNTGQADYAMANQALGRLAATWKRSEPGRRVTAIDWGAWDGGMVTPELREVFLARGVPLLPPDTGARMFTEQFATNRHDDVEVLAGPATTLSEPPVAAPTPGLLARRDIATVAADPVIADHRIGAHPVLPASAALGWMASTVERANPGLKVVEVRGFDVQRGIVFDGGQEPEYWLHAEPGEVEADSRLAVPAAVLSNPDGARQSHYRAVFVLAPEPAPGSTLPGYVVGEGPENGLRTYADADLFHGPLLQGVRRILEREPRRLVTECRLTDTPVAGGGYAAALHSPVLGDVVLQCAAVLGVWFLDAGCLPLAIARWEFFAPLPDGEPFVAVVGNLRDGPMTVTVDVSVCEPGGGVLQRLTDVTIVATADMRAKFAEAVRLRETELR